MLCRNLHFQKGFRFNYLFTFDSNPGSNAGRRLAPQQTTRAASFLRPDATTDVTAVVMDVTLAVMDVALVVMGAATRVCRLAHRVEAVLQVSGCWHRFIAPCFRMPLHGRKPGFNQNYYTFTLIWTRHRT
jgi:hypothetical protein